MTAAHLIYIPMILIVGLALGFFLGGRAARDAFALEQKKAEKRAAARAARAAAAAAAAAPAPAPQAPAASGADEPRKDA